MSEVKGIISELSEIRRIEIGLKLREAKEPNGILYNSEGWSNVSDADMERLKQVATAVLRALVDKCQMYRGILLPRIGRSNGQTHNHTDKHHKIWNESALGPMQ